MPWRTWLLLLGACALVLGAVGGHAAEQVLEAGKALDDAIQVNIEAQDSVEGLEPKPVKAQVVKQDAPATLASGTGDLSSTGECVAELDAHCATVRPGEGRLAKCLAEQVEGEEAPGYAGERTGPKCRAALEAFRVERARNVNADLPLARACKDDAAKHCAKLDKGQTVLGCLRSHREEVQPACGEQLLARQVDAAADWQLDIELANACKDDVKSHCAGTTPTGGAVQECLRGQRTKLSWPCQEQLFRQDVEDASDLRLSTRLFRACLADKKKFCPNVAPGNVRAKECLEEHRGDAGFSAPCRTELDKMIAARAADFRLDPQLRELCKADIEDTNLCAADASRLDKVQSHDASVILCLQDFREELSSPACAARVAKTMEYAFSDIRFDAPLAEWCHDDREQLCSGVAPGSARVIRCLQDRREDLSVECKVRLFLEEESMAESVDFQYPLKAACGADLTKFCGRVQHSHAKAIRCLEDNKDQAGFGAKCAAEVQKHLEFSARDYRLNYRLNHACENTITELCDEACPSSRFEDKQPCGGTVLRCLTEKLDRISNEDCKNEVTYFAKMGVSDFRNDVLLAEACRKDVEGFCADVEPGEGRVHQCLRDHREHLSEACRLEESQLQILQSSNAELMPALARSCRAERRRFCPSVRPGKARVFSCLLAHAGAGDAGFGADCAARVAQQQARRLADWRLDYDLRAACKDDVAKHCSSPQTPASRNGTGVLQCLVDKAAGLSPGCAEQTGRAVRNALQFFNEGQPVTSVCDGDVKATCPPPQPGRPQAVRQCLAARMKRSRGGPPQAAEVALQLPQSLQTEEQKAGGSGTRRLLEDAAAAAAAGAGAAPLKPTGGPLSPGCEALLGLAEPGDAYAWYSSALSAAALTTQVAGLEQRLGLKEGRLLQRDTGLLTLTGWSAIAGIVALVLVGIGGAVLAYRRYRGLDQMSTYTLVSKQQPRVASPPQQRAA